MEQNEIAQYDFDFSTPYIFWEFLNINRFPFLKISKASQEQINNSECDYLTFDG